MTASDLKKLQYYNAGEYILQRIVKSVNCEITTGKIRRSDGKFIEEIIVRKFTPALAEIVEDMSLYISFEEGYSLKYGLADDSIPYGAGPYLLSGRSDAEGSLEVQYGKFWYNVVSRDNTYNALMVGLDSIEDIQSHHRTVPGRKIF